MKFKSILSACSELMAVICLLLGMFLTISDGVSDSSISSAIYACVFYLITIRIEVSK